MTKAKTATANEPEDTKADPAILTPEDITKNLELEAQRLQAIGTAQDERQSDLNTEQENLDEKQKQFDDDLMEFSNMKAKAAEEAAEEATEANKKRVANMTDEDLQIEEGQEAMELANAELKVSVADEYREIEDKQLSATALAKDPDKLASQFIRLYADYRKMEAKVNALVKERATLLPRATRCDVAERRLSIKQKHSVNSWLRLPMLDRDGWVCCASPLTGLNARGVVELSYAKEGESIVFKTLINATLIAAGDDAYTIEVAAR